MTWVRLDEEMPDHPKVLLAGPLASWLHVCALAYCNRYLTDGFVPAAQVRKLADFEDVRTMEDYTGQDAADLPDIDPFRLAEKLVTIGMWERREGAYLIHDYLDYQPSRSEVEAQRKAKSEAGKVGGQRSGVTRRTKSEANPKQTRSKPEAEGEARASLNGHLEPKQNRSENEAGGQAKTKPVPVPVSEYSSSSNHLVAAPVENEEEEDPRVGEALVVLVDRRWAGRQGPTVNDPPAWRRRTLANVRADYGDELRALCVNSTTPEAMAEHVEPRGRSEGLAAVTSTLPKRVFVEDDETGRGRWEDDAMGVMG